MNMPSKRLDAISLGIIVFYRMVLATEGKTSSRAWEAPGRGGAHPHLRRPGRGYAGGM